MALLFNKLPLPMLLAACALLVTNLLGEFLSLRHPDVDHYVDFAGVRTTQYSDALAQLQRLSTEQPPRDELLQRATRIFHEGMAHIAPEDVRDNGLTYYRMRVPVYENWILYVLSYLKPDTYMDYEFCKYERALERGTGRCGQQSLALVDYLHSLQVPTGFVALGGHAIATAQSASGQWHLLDPDYGGVLPFDIETAQANTDQILEYYWSDVASVNRIDRAYLPAHNKVKLGGPEARYARACKIETAAYWLKWGIPVLLLMCALVLGMISRHTTAERK